MGNNYPGVASHLSAMHRRVPPCASHTVCRFLRRDVARLDAQQHRASHRDYAPPHCSSHQPFVYQFTYEAHRSSALHAVPQLCASRLSALRQRFICNFASLRRTTLHHSLPRSAELCVSPAKLYPFHLAILPASRSASYGPVSHRHATLRLSPCRHASHQPLTKE
jgi:hypothetical protein